MNKNEVNTAFEMLLETIEEVINILIKEGEETFKAQDFDKAKALIEHGERLKCFREKVKALQNEWQSIFSENILVQTEEKQAEEEKQEVEEKKLVKEIPQRRWRTPEKEFIIPILESLIELGGKAQAKDVLRLVHEKMKNILTKHDYEPLLSDPKQIRWENTARWARNTMVNEGLLAKNSPPGIWEITEKGRKFYEENKKILSLPCLLI